MQDFLTTMGAHDFWVCNSIAPDGLGAMIGVGEEDGGRQFTYASFGPWRNAITHLRAAFRLRRLLARGEGLCEAVLSPDGRRVQHLEGQALEPDARDALRMATRLLDRQRAPKSVRDPLEALLARRVLVSGRWSLVDRFESDGRRYTVAWVNDPVPRGRLFPELAVREEQIAVFVALGHSLKLIAYDLGLNLPTVARGVRRSQTKLGLANRSALIRQVHARVDAMLASGIDGTSAPTTGT